MAKLKLYVLLWIIWYMLNRSRTLAVDFENMTSQYKNYVFSGVNCDIDHSLLG
jgi:hypothetical protein